MIKVLPQLATLLFHLVNAERAARGLDTLAWSDSLAAVALAHGKDMAREGFHGHISPKTGSPEDRLKAFGIEGWTYMGENIAEEMVEGLDEDEVSLETIAQLMLKGWLESPGHRENMLRPQFTKTGIGALVKRKPDGSLRFIAVQVFTGP